MSAIYRREMRAYFTSIISYVFFAAFFAIEGLMFAALYQGGSTEVFRIPFMFPLYLTIFLIPLLTMRTISEDKRQKVDQVLLTAPVSVTSIIMGKFWACVSIYAIANAPLLIFQTIVSYYAAVNWLQFLYSLLGTLLLGSALIALGIFISSITESTALAAVLSVVANIVIMFISQIFEIIGIEWLTKITSAVALLDRFTSFSDSILKVDDIVYYITVIAVFVFLSVRSVEKRRWS